MSTYIKTLEIFFLTFHGIGSRFEARTEVPNDLEVFTTLAPTLELPTPSPGLEASAEAEQKSVDLEEDELPTYSRASELARATVGPLAYKGSKAAGESKAAKVKQATKTTVVRKGRRRPKFENFRDIENVAELNDNDDADADAVDVDVDSSKAKIGLKKVDFGAPALSQSSLGGRSAKAIGKASDTSTKRLD